MYIHKEDIPELAENLTALLWESTEIGQMDSGTWANVLGLVQEMIAELREEATPA